MRLIYLSEKETQAIKEALRQQDIVHFLVISAQYGKYKKSEYLKTAWGERLLVVDNMIIKDLEDFKRKYVLYPELSYIDLAEINRQIGFKKIEILKLKRIKNSTAEPVIPEKSGLKIPPPIRSFGQH